MGQQLTQPGLSERVASPVGRNSSALAALACVAGLKIGADPGPGTTESANKPSARPSTEPSAGPSSGPALPHS